MAQIDIRRRHSLTLPRARKEANLLAEHLKQEFELESSWSGNQLSFKRSGVNGVMTVGSEDVHVMAELGFLVSFLKSRIEARLNAHFDDVFGKAGVAPAKKAAAAKKAAPAKKAAGAKKAAATNKPVRR